MAIAFALVFTRSFHPRAAEHDRTPRNLLLLSLVNWGVAIMAWTISAYLGITSPASIIVYTVLFVIGLFAATVAVGAVPPREVRASPGADPVSGGRR